MLAMVDSMGGSGGTSPDLYTVVRKSSKNQKTNLT